MSIQLHPSWLPALQNEFKKPYMLGLKQFLVQEKEQGHVVYPKGSDLFNAFNLTPFNEVKVVILGQDPYHGANQAHGYSFSVQKGLAIPPSLQNIYKELQTDIPGFKIPNHGNLTDWATQGVLLLNATLTVRANEPGSHQKMGWEQFTDQAIQALSEQREGLVFMLWGRYAQAKAALIDNEKHLVLTAAHPSPFSAYNGFFGCKHFSKANAYLLAKGEKPISWALD
ncbi:MAG: uracil-DNA glycosylase [Sphingobacteriaceae bacterium]